MQYKRGIRYVVLIALALLAPALLSNSIPRAHAISYNLGTIPFITQEGSTITFVFQVTGATGSTVYRFQFFVRDPASNTHQSILENYTTLPGQTIFTLPPFYYPTASFPGPNSLVGQYIAWANQVQPGPTTTVASTYFFLILTDKTGYQRTETVNIHATGYKPAEVVNIRIATQTTDTTAFTQTLTASSSGVVVSNWKIPRNATIDTNGYIITVNGTLTVKTPADVQGFTISAATMAISALASSKSVYQRTETMSFSFQPVYPDGTTASTGVALLTLARPDGANITLTTTYSSGSQTFNATYKTSVDNETGTWTATLAANGYSDSWGNTGPGAKLTSTPQLVPASFTMNVVATPYVAIGQQLKFNVTITYPDGSELQTGSVSAFLLYSGSPQVNDTVSVIFDSGLQFWVGSYNLQSSDPGGLWTLVIRASDSSTPPNTGSASKAVTTQDHPPIASFNPSPTSAPTGTAINLDGTASYDPDGTVTTWSWNFGDGNSGLGATASHTYNTAGVYTITLTVTDNSGSTDTTTSQVTITDRPPVASFTPGSTSAPTGSSISFDATASNDPDGTISTWSWNFGDGNSGLGITTSHSYAASGSFTVTLTVTDNSGSSASTSVQVTVTDRPPTVSFVPSTTTPSSGQLVTVSITATDPDGSVSTIRVDWGDGTVHTLSGGATSDSHTYSSTGLTASKTYTISVTATDNAALTSVASTSNITVPAGSSGSSNGNGLISLPLYYFGILAALIAALLIGGFLVLRRHKVTHARLKIDLEAVRSEAGRIENNEFFQSVKDQLKKDKDD